MPFLKEDLQKPKQKSRGSPIWIALVLLLFITALGLLVGPTLTGFAGLDDTSPYEAERNVAENPRPSYGLSTGVPLTIGLTLVFVFLIWFAFIREIAVDRSSWKGEQDSLSERVTQYLAEGMPEDEIREVLVDSGWESDVIDRAMVSAK